MVAIDRYEAERAVEGDGWRIVCDNLQIGGMRAVVGTPRHQMFDDPTRMALAALPRRAQNFENTDKAILCHAHAERGRTDSRKRRLRHQRIQHGCKLCMRLGRGLCGRNKSVEPARVRRWRCLDAWCPAPRVRRCCHDKRMVLLPVVAGGEGGVDRGVCQRRYRLCL